MINEVEVWKTIDGYEDYQVSNLGRVKSFKYKKELILKSNPNRKGYLQLKITNNKKHKSFAVHVLVAMMFHGHKPDGTSKIVVDHIDNNKLNNHADNLRLTTNRENASKDRKGGTSKYVGVVFDKNLKKWRSAITFLYRFIYLGCYDSEIEAKNAYDKALDELNQGLDLNVLYPKGKHKTSKYKYVSWYKNKQKWLAKYKDKFIGYYETELEAYQAVQEHIKNLQTK